jgi:DNA-binding NarL/FixJ family response regulator
MPTISILIADEREIIRTGLCHSLAEEPGFEVVADTADKKELFRVIEKNQPDILLLGFALPTKEMVQILKDLIKRNPATRILLLLDQVPETDLFELLRAGAKGSLPSNMPLATLKKAVRTVADGEYWIDRKTSGKLFSEFLEILNPPKATRIATHTLTKREIEVLRLLAQGCKNKEIADRLFISDKTVKTHLTNIFTKLKIKDRLQAALYVIENDLEA